MPWADISAFCSTKAEFIINNRVPLKLLCQCSKRTLSHTRWIITMHTSSWNINLLSSNIYLLNKNPVIGSECINFFSFVRPVFIGFSWPIRLNWFLGFWKSIFIVLSTGFYTSWKRFVLASITFCKVYKYSIFSFCSFKIIP